MNWLAHLRLSPPDPLLRLGNLAGDFVQGIELATLHPDLQRGIAMHRAVDRFVDAHPLVAAARARVPPALQRVAPRLCTEGWIEGYAHLDGLERVFALMARRLPRPTSLATGAEPLRRHYAEFAADFAALWPQLTAQLAAPAVD